MVVEERDAEPARLERAFVLTPLTTTAAQFMPSCPRAPLLLCGAILLQRAVRQDTILVDMMNGPENSKVVSYCVTDPDVSLV